MRDDTASGTSQAGSDALLACTYDYLPWARGRVEAWHGTGLPACAISAACALVSTPAGELVLVDVRTRGWDVPGGHLEHGENPAQALARELAEEAGLLPGEYDTPRLRGWIAIHPDDPGIPVTAMLVYSTTLTSTRAWASAVPHEIAGVRAFALDDLPEQARDAVWSTFAARAG